MFNFILFELTAHIMKSTFLALKISLMFLTFLMLTACGDRSYPVDFSSREFPEIREEMNVEADLELYREIERYSNHSSDVKAETDKKTYRAGEEVVLTIHNNSQSTEYFYPSDEQVKRRETLIHSKSLYLKSLVSKDPAIHGDLMFHDARLVFLVLEGTNSLESSEYGMDGMNESLDPGEKMVFRIKMPKRQGRYIVSLMRFSPGPENFPFGANAFIQSNVFEVVK